MHKQQTRDKGPQWNSGQWIMNNGRWEDGPMGLDVILIRRNYVLPSKDSLTSAHLDFDSACEPPPHLLHSLRALHRCSTCRRRSSFALIDNRGRFSMPVNTSDPGS